MCFLALFIEDFVFKLTIFFVSFRIFLMSLSEAVLVFVWFILDCSI